MLIIQKILKETLKVAGFNYSKLLHILCHKKSNMTKISIYNYFVYSYWALSYYFNNILLGLVLKRHMPTKSSKMILTFLYNENYENKKLIFRFSNTKLKLDQTKL